MNTFIIYIIILSILVPVITLIYMIRTAEIGAFNLYILDAFGEALEEIDVNDPHFNNLIAEYDRHFNDFKIIYDNMNNRYLVFKKLNVTNIYGESIADYLKPYIDEKYL